MKNTINTIFGCALVAGALLFAGCSSSGTQTAQNAAPAPAAAPAAPAADYTVKEANETVNIEVAANGYTPKTIAVKKGMPVKLAFHRKDEKNCGEELVFPSLNIKKELPVGQTVVVEVTPDASGEIKFACGMDMLRGKLIVMD